MRTFLTLLFSYFIAVSIAQTSDKKNFGIVLGNVIEAQSNKAVSFATVGLQLISDTTIVYKTVSDKNGAFELDRIAFGYYRLKIEAIGFNTFQLDSIHLREERYDFNLGDLKINPSSNLLTDVVVYSEKPILETKEGSITLNVGESALSGGATTSELLKSMPLVSTDPNGNILLKGKEPKILIDERPTELTSQQLQDLLESLPGSSIEKIELMLNPPPQFANEPGGVINIVTKKGKIGWVGRLNLSGGTRGEGNFSGNASYRNQKMAVSIQTGLGVSQFTGFSYSRRTNIYRDSTNGLNTDADFINQNLRPNARVQLDYDWDKFRTINISYQGNLNLFKNENETWFSNINRFDEVYRRSQRSNISDGIGFSHGIQLAYTLKSKTKPGARWQFQMSGNLGRNENDRDFFQQFLDGSMNVLFDSTQQQLLDYQNGSYAIRINYNRPIGKKGHQLATGTYFSSNQNRNSLVTQFLRKQDQTFIESPLLSNDYNFNMDIWHYRLSMTWVLHKTVRLIVGAALEKTDISFQFFKGNSADISNAYWNLLPNFTLRKEFNKSFNTSFVYRATIRRPGIGELNPNVDYNDPYNLRFGNPFLQPTLTDNFDWNISYVKGKYNFNTSVGYNRVKNIFNTIRTLIEQGKTQVTWLNIADRQEYELSAWGGYTFSKKLRMNLSAGYTYLKYGEEEKRLFRYRDGSTFYTSLNYSLTLNPLTVFEGNARFSSFADPQGRTRSNINMNLGFQRKLFEKRMTVGFNIIDPFTTQQTQSFTFGPNFSLESFRATRTRNFRLSVSWQLNKMVQKSTMSEKQKKQALEKVQKASPKST